MPPVHPLLVGQLSCWLAQMLSAFLFAQLNASFNAIHSALFSTFSQPFHSVIHFSSLLDTDQRTKPTPDPYLE